ncbi:MBOAT, membrane-bound O-acyltransferase family-domain-containing protein [Gorgonomyces haynaldii]|nr:MBOAT, membrane-bound O-acyltransferase family-domain-containing protein [Gorgonomyces haynaldii]
MDDTQRYILLIASQFPLAFLFQQIPAANAAQRHLFSIVTSSVLILTVYDSFCLLNIMSATFYTFLLTSFFGRLKFTPWLVFGLLMSHMTFVHYVHQIAYPDSIDGSATMMVLVMKLSSFAWSVFDGGQTKLSLDQRQHKIDKMPSLLTLYGYSFFFLGVWIGPAIEFTVYHDFVNEKGPFDQPRFSRSRIFRTLVLGLGIFYLSSTVFQQFDPASDLKEYSFIYKLFYLHMAAIGFRLKFMAGWKLVESACLTTRLGFNKIDPKTNRPSFDRCQNVDIMRVEFAENVKMLAESWNHYTHLWLRRTVYDRFSENKSVANVATYLTSALWHGFYRIKIHPSWLLFWLLVWIFVDACWKTVAKACEAIVSCQISQIQDSV